MVRKSNGDPTCEPVVSPLSLNAVPRNSYLFISGDLQMNDFFVPTYVPRIHFGFLRTKLHPTEPSKP